MRDAFRRSNEIVKFYFIENYIAIRDATRSLSVINIIVSYYKCRERTLRVLVSTASPGSDVIQSLAGWVNVSTRRLIRISTIESALSEHNTSTNNIMLRCKRQLVICDTYWDVTFLRCVLQKALFTVIWHENETLLSHNHPKTAKQKYGYYHILLSLNLAAACCNF